MNIELSFEDMRPIIENEIRKEVISLVRSFFKEVPIRNMIDCAISDYCRERVNKVSEHLNDDNYIIAELKEQMSVQILEESKPIMKKILIYGINEYFED